MTTGPLWDVYPWQRPMTMACDVTKAVGLVLVEWPSGRKTAEIYGATVLVSDWEQDMVRNRAALLAAKLENLDNTMADFSARLVKNGWLIRTKRRRKPRRILAATFVKPSAYTGPAPSAHGILP